MTDRKIEILAQKPVFEGYFRIDRYRLRHSLHEGGMSEEITREVFERGHATAVLPFDPIRDEVVLIEQFRIGAHAAGKNPWLTEIVAGIIEVGETAEGVARREVGEETGLDVMALWPMAEYLVSPGGASEQVSLFLGQVDATNAGGIHGLDHEAEDIRVFALPYREAAGLLDQGQVGNAMTLIALQWLRLHHDEVVNEWRRNL
jgi:ADP-ribose pyrophosphatase